MTKRLRIIQLISNGISNRQTARLLGVSDKSVAHYRDRLVSPMGISDSPKSGRQKVTTLRMRRRMGRMITFRECDTAVQVRSSIIMEEGKSPSFSTTKRILHSIKLISAVKRKKPFLNARHRRHRLAFARKYRKWTVDDWRRVVFSDETKNQLFGSYGREYCWRMPNESLNSRIVNPTVKHGGSCIMVWGCMTSGGVGFMCKINEGLDAELYRQILNG